MPEHKSVKWHNGKGVAVPIFLLAHFYNYTLDPWRGPTGHSRHVRGCSGQLGPQTTWQNLGAAHASLTGAGGTSAVLARSAPPPESRKARIPPQPASIFMRHILNFTVASPIRKSEKTLFLKKEHEKFHFLSQRLTRRGVLHDPTHRPLPRTSLQA